VPIPLGTHPPSFFGVSFGANRTGYLAKAEMSASQDGSGVKLSSLSGEIHGYYGRQLVGMDSLETFDIAFFTGKGDFVNLRVPEEALPELRRELIRLCE